jgi:hypothetical protein
MDIRSRAFALRCLIASTFVLTTVVSAQNLPNTTGLLRFPTTNGTQIVFCYAGELYTVGKNDGAPSDGRSGKLRGANVVFIVLRCG